MMLLIKKIHKWTAALIGIQLLIWLLSGLYFNVMDHSKAAGRTYKNSNVPTAVIDKNRLVEMKTILQKFNPSHSIKIISLLKQPYYLLNHEHGLYKHFSNTYTLVHAYSGQEVEVDESLAKKLALSSYNGPGEIYATELLNPPIEDFPKQKNSTWQISFSDELNTSVYIEYGSGRIVGHSDDEQRLAGIFFMLHFMDYNGEGSFNNIQIMALAFITLWLCLSGFIWTIELVVKGKYNLAIFTNKQSLFVISGEDNESSELAVFKGKYLLENCNENAINIPSTCGGNGTCGRCKVIVSPAINSTSIDFLHLSEKELEQGFRLACQHKVNGVKSIKIPSVM